MDNITKIFEVFDFIERNNITSMNKKLELLKDVKDLPEFKTVMNYVVKKDIVFNISEKRLPLVSSKDDKQKATFKDFEDLSLLIMTRKITGNKQVKTMISFLEQCDNLHAKWYRRIWLKDLRIGIGKGISKKLISITNATVMKADPLKNVPNIEDRLKKGYFVEPKIDGIRMLIVISDNGIEYLSRNMKPLTDYVASKFDPFIAPIASSFNNIVLDGELFNFDWSKTASLRRKKIDANLLKTAKFFVFDIFTLEAFKNQTSFNRSLKDRKKSLSKVYDALIKNDPKAKDVFELVNSVGIAHSVKEAQEYSQTYVNMGYEGIMLKDPDSYYYFKRTHDWIKVKPMETIDLLCVRIEESKKMKQHLKSIVVKYKGVETHVGSGFTLEQRKYFFEKPELIVNHVVEIMYQEIGSQGRLRFPVFVRVRYDKNKPDA